MTPFLSDPFRVLGMVPTCLSLLPSFCKHGAGSVVPPHLICNPPPISRFPSDPPCQQQERGCRRWAGGQAGAADEVSPATASGWAWAARTHRVTWRGESLQSQSCSRGASAGSEDKRVPFYTDGANGGSKLAVPSVQCCLTASFHVSSLFVNHV